MPLPQDDPTPLEWIFYFGFWVMAAVIFAVKLRRGTLIHAESRKQRLDRERAASMTPLLCEQCGKQTTPTESEATPSEVTLQPATHPVYNDYPNPKPL